MYTGVVPLRNSRGPYYIHGDVLNSSALIMTFLQIQGDEGLSV
jgi:hypothetical protein